MAVVRRLKISTLVESVPGECPVCMFDALRRVQGFHLTPSGVTPVFDLTYCGRCRAENQRETESPEAP